MKKAFIGVSALFLIFLITSAYINGPAKRGHDKTGSPVSSGKCLDCHSGGQYSPSLSIKMLDGDMEVNSYEPGKTYTLKYQLFNTGSPAAFGFQTTVLDPSNQFAGSFGTVPSGFQQTTLKEVKYVEHSSPRPLSSFQIDWTAPAESNETITIYAGSVAVNGNNNTGGDGGDVDALVLQPATSSVVEGYDEDSEIFQLIKNPVDGELPVRIESGAASIRFTIIGSDGRKIAQWLEKNPEAGMTFTFDLSNLEHGLYFLIGEKPGSRQATRFIRH